MREDRERSKREIKGCENEIKWNENGKHDHGV